MQRPALGPRDLSVAAHFVLVGGKYFYLCFRGAKNVGRSDGRLLRSNLLRKREGIAVSVIWEGSFAV